MEYISSTPPPSPPPNLDTNAILQRRVPHLFSSRRQPRRSKRLEMSSPPLSLSRFDMQDDDSASAGHSSMEVVGQLRRPSQGNVLATLDLETLSSSRYGLSDGGHSSQGRIPSDLETTQLENSSPRRASENSIDRNLSDRAFSEGWLSQARVVGSSQGSWHGSVQSSSDRVLHRHIEGSDRRSLANILRSNSTSSLRSNAGSSVQGVPSVHDQSASAPSVHDQSGSEHPSSSPDSSFLTAPSHISSSSSAAIVPRAAGTPSVRTRSSAPSDSDREQRPRSPLTSGIASPTSSVAGGDENSAKSRPRARACSAPPGDAGARKYPRRAPVQTIRDISSGEVSFDTGLSISSSPILGPDAETLRGYKRAMKTAEESLANERRERSKELDLVFRLHASDVRRIEEKDAAQVHRLEEQHAAIVRRLEESLKREREEREAEVRREKDERANEVRRVEETLKREREDRANEVRRFEESLKREREEREAEVRREKEARANEVGRLEERLESLKKTLQEAREEKAVLFNKLLEKV